MSDNIQTNPTGRLTPCLQKKIIHITVKNPDGKESGVMKTALNGVVLPDNYIKADLLEPENEVIVEL